METYLKKTILFIEEFHAQRHFLHIYNITELKTPKCLMREEELIMASQYDGSECVFKVILLSTYELGLMNLGFPSGSEGEEYVCNAGVPRSGRSPREWNRYPQQHSCLENFMDTGAWRATVHGVVKSWT